MSSFIHDVLSRWSRDANWPYPSSILMVNKNVPLFEEKYGRHDYLWMLEVTKDRKCKEIEPCVIRYVGGKNLSFNPMYREEDYQMVYNHLWLKNDIAGIKRLNATRAKYFYKLQDYKRARHYFKISSHSVKNIAYYFTSFVPVLAKWIVKKYTVFG